eukprot:1075956-Rhodomonas_salina.1
MKELGSVAREDVLPQLTQRQPQVLGDWCLKNPLRRATLDPGGPLPASLRLCRLTLRDTEARLAPVGKPTLGQPPATSRRAPADEAGWL